MNLTMFSFRPLTWAVLITASVGGTLLDNAVDGGALGYFVVLFGAMLLAGLTDRDRFYGADLVRQSRQRRHSRGA